MASRPLPHPRRGHAHRTDPEKGSARLAPPLHSSPTTANARGKVAENATLPLCQPAAAVRQVPFLPRSAT
ncbi:MAG: hypothetical protein SFV22_19585 [Saprospiraceae bacterium]|nr:hypothetical protein [Saprospiraceae bacterium]